MYNSIPLFKVYKLQVIRPPDFLPYTPIGGTTLIFEDLDSVCFGDDADGEFVEGSGVTVVEDFHAFSCNVDGFFFCD